MKIYILVLIFTLSANLTPAQAQLHLDWIYQGENLYFQNPKTAHGLFCMDSVFLNGNKLLINTASAAFEIELATLGFHKNDSLHILIYHKAGYAPRLLNFSPFIPFHVAIKNIFISKSGILTWETAFDAPCYLIVQQYKWHSWYNLDTLQTGKEGVFETYSYQTNLHSGVNKFRILANGYGHFRHSSRTIELKSELQPVKFKLDKTLQKIQFSGITSYEVIDATGRVVIAERGKTIDLKELTKKKYWLRFDNTYKTIKLRWNR